MPASKKSNTAHPSCTASSHIAARLSTHRQQFGGSPLYRSNNYLTPGAFPGLFCLATWGLSGSVRHKQCSLVDVVCRRFTACRL